MEDENGGCQSAAHDAARRILRAGGFLWRAGAESE